MLAPAAQKTRAGPGSVQTDAKLPEFRRYSRLRPKPFQPRPIPGTPRPLLRPALRGAQPLCGGALNTIAASPKARR